MTDHPAFDADFDYLYSRGHKVISRAALRTAWTAVKSSEPDFRTARIFVRVVRTWAGTTIEASAVRAALGPAIARRVPAGERARFFDKTASMLENGAKWLDDMALEMRDELDEIVAMELPSGMDLATAEANSVVARLHQHCADARYLARLSRLAEKRNRQFAEGRGSLNVAEIIERRDDSLVDLAMVYWSLTGNPPNSKCTGNYETGTFWTEFAGPLMNCAFPPDETTGRTRGIGAFAQRRVREIVAQVTGDAVFELPYLPRLDR